MLASLNSSVLTVTHPLVRSAAMEGPTIHAVVRTHSNKVWRRFHKGLTFIVGKVVGFTTESLQKFCLSKGTSDQQV